jgi:hypothetical protein
MDGRQARVRSDQTRRADPDRPGTNLSRFSFCDAAHEVLSGDDRISRQNRDKVELRPGIRDRYERSAWVIAVSDSI